MVAPPVLVGSIAEAVGEKSSAVGVTLRRLRDAKLIRVEGRGRHAIELHAADAVKLLIAVCAAVPLEPQAAAKAVARFEKLEGALAESEAAKQWRPEDLIFPVDMLPKIHTFDTALITLLEAGGRNGLLECTDSAGKRLRNPLGYVRIGFFMPIPVVRIEHALGGFVRKEWRYGPSHTIGPPYLSVVRDRYRSGRSTLVEIDEQVLEAVGGALAGKRS